MTTREVFRTNVRYYRKKSGLTQEALAERIGCNAKYLSEIESRAKFPSPETVDSLSAALGVPVSALFAEQGSPQAAAAFDREAFAEELTASLHALIRQDVLDFLARHLEE